MASSPHETDARQISCREPVCVAGPEGAFATGSERPRAAGAPPLPICRHCRWRAVATVRLRPAVPRPSVSGVAARGTRLGALPPASSMFGSYRAVRRVISNRPRPYASARVGIGAHVMQLASSCVRSSASITPIRDGRPRRGTAFAEMDVHAHLRQRGRPAANTHLSLAPPADRCQTNA